MISLHSWRRLYIAPGGVCPDRHDFKFQSRTVAMSDTYCHGTWLFEIWMAIVRYRVESDIYEKTPTSRIIRTITNTYMAIPYRALKRPFDAVEKNLKNLICTLANSNPRPLVQYRTGVPMFQMFQLGFQLGTRFGTPISIDSPGVRDNSLVMFQCSILFSNIRIKLFLY